MDCMIVLIVIGAAAFFFIGRTRKGPPVSSNEVRAVYRDQLPAETKDEVWKEAPVYTANLILQDLVEPRLLKPSTPECSCSSGHRWEEACISYGMG